MENALSDVVASIASIESLVKLIALLMGGIWSYHLFLRYRNSYPRATITHEVTVNNLPCRQLLLTVGVTIRNDGKVLLPLTFTETWVRQLLPLSATILRAPQSHPPTSLLEGDLPLLAYEKSQWVKNSSHASLPHRLFDALRGQTYQQREVEPGEVDTIYYYFILDTFPSAFVVITFVHNNAKVNLISWKTRTVYRTQELLAHRMLGRPSRITQQIHTKGKMTHGYTAITLQRRTAPSSNGDSFGNAPR